MVAGANSSTPLTTPLLQRLTPSIYFLNDGLKEVLRKMSNGVEEKQFENIQGAKGVERFYES